MATVRERLQTVKDLEPSPLKALATASTILADAVLAALEGEEDE